MSHTNTTPNYNLPQFVGTDKPAWLTDINQAFSGIDTAIKSAKDTADTATGSATTANNSIGTITDLNTTNKSNLVGAINEVNTKVGTAQETANTAIGSVNRVSSDLSTFEQKFNLTNITQGNSINYSVTGTATNGMTLAQNSDGSIFKAYGYFEIGKNSSCTVQSVEGKSGYYGIDTGLVLKTAPSEAFIIKSSGFEIQMDTNSGANRWINGKDIAVGTNGHIYINLRQVSGNINADSSYNITYNYMPCIYFNGSFGDTPSPSN